MSEHVHIRPARFFNDTATTEIYTYYILHTPATFDLEPFSVERRREEWWSHYSDEGPHRVLVAEREGNVDALAWSSQFRPKAAYNTSVETSVYCAPEAVGCGLGPALYRQLLAILDAQPLHRAIAAITQPNEASMKLHRSFGFVEVGRVTEVGLKFGKYWDVAYLERPIPGS